MSIPRPQEEDARQRITQRTVTVDRSQEREAEPEAQQAPDEETPTRITQRTVSVPRPQEEDTR